jgi:hypothetical protein
MFDKPIAFAILPRAGLANRLFPWAHAKIFSEKHQLPMYTHGWGHLHVGPWLRFEKSKRFYYFYFKSNTAVLKYSARRIASALGCHNICCDTKSISDQIATYVFSEVPSKKDYFVGLRGHEEYLRQELNNNLRSKHQFAANSIEPYPVAIHVRRGDFVVAGLALSTEEYFIEIVHKLRGVIGDSAEIRIFSDALPSELSQLLSLPNVKMAQRKPDIIELLEISKAKIIVTSLGSTFGYWAAFLSEADIIVDDRHQFGTIRSPDTIPNRFEGTIADYLNFRESA